MPLRKYPRSTFVANEQPQRVYSYLDVAPSPSSSSTTSSSHVPPILFLHGFPDLAIGWSSQIDHFSARGHRCIAPDMLGYGLSSRPSREEGRLGEYSLKSMSEDMARLVRDALERGVSPSGVRGGEGAQQGKVIVISHDHGANFAWRFTQYNPDLVCGMVGLCVPYARITDRWASRKTMTQLIPTFGYQEFFEETRSTELIQDELEDFFINIYGKVGLFTLDPDQDRSESDAPEYAGNLERLLLQARDTGERMDGSGGAPKRTEERKKSLIMSADTFDFYMKQFASEKGGIDGALNWYRTRRINFDQEQDVKDKAYPTSFPVLAVVPDRDAALPSALFSNLNRDIPHAERLDMRKCGHFVQLEQPRELAKAVETWMDRHGLSRAGAGRGKKASL